MSKFSRFTVLFFAICAMISLMALGAAAQDREEISLLYDDRKDLSALVDAEGEVVISDEVVTSYQVGTTEKDPHVLVYEDGILYAVGTGTATLTVEETSYSVTVSPAPLSLLMITGHSGGAGQEGNGSQSVVVEAGQAYSSYHQNSLDVTEVAGYGLGWGSPNRVGGEEGLVRPKWDSYGHIDAFAPGMGGTTGCGSGLAYRWNQLSGEKIWVMNIAIGGSCINEWLPGSHGHNTAYDLNYYDQTISKFTYAQTILKNEVAAGHYTLSKQVILNFGGSNFSWYSGWNFESVQEDYKTLWEAYEQELFAIDIDGDGSPDGLDAMAIVVSISSQVYSGDRPALWYMGSSAEYGQNVVVSQLIQKLYTMEGIQAHFPAIDYTTQSVPVYVPESVYHIDHGGTSEHSVFCATDGVHLSQVTNNAQGLEIGENLFKWFFEDEKHTAAQSITFHDYSTARIPDNVGITVGQTLLMTPQPVPVTASDLTYEVTGAAELVYPLGIRGTSVGTATLTVKQGDRVIETMTFRVSEAHSHCVCGGTLTGDSASYHTCEEAVTYVPLNINCYTYWRYTTSSGTNTYTANALRSGNYFLTQDMSRSSTIYIAPGEKVNLCLNGHKLTTTTRSLIINGQLNICDCSQGQTGAIYSKSSGNAPTVYTASGGTVSIYGGTYSAVASATREFAGCLGVSHDLSIQNCDPDGDGTLDNTTKVPATMNIYGGKFIGSDLNCKDGSPTAGGAGACIHVVTNNNLNIYGGEFVGARPVPVQDGGTGGGGILSNSGTTKIYGGTFIGSRCPMGAIYTINSKLTISGNPIFRDNDHADIFLQYCDHLYVGSAGLSVTTPIRVAGSLDNFTQIHLTQAEEAACFVGTHGLTMGTPDSSNIMKFTMDRTYCECGGTLTDDVKALSGHVCQDKTWSYLCQNNLSSRFTTTSTTEGQTSSTRYYLKSKEVWLYLSSNVNLTNEIEISAGYTLHLDLNGYTITHSAGSASLFRVYGKLTICDSYGGGRAIGVRTGQTDGEASCVYVQNYNTYGKILGAPKFDFYSGTLTGRNITSATDRTQIAANQAGVVQIGNNPGNKLAQFNMYGGTIRDGWANVAGNLLLGHGIMNIYDGLITGGTSTTYGGNIRISSGNQFTMYGGIVSNGTSGSYGANIQISSGTNRILGGTFENGWAETNGGNVYLGGGTLEIRDAKLLGGCADYGGNLYVYAGTANVYDTQMRDGKSGYTFTRNSDGTLTYSTNNAPSGNGGNIYINNAAANLQGCTLENGNAYGKNSTNGIGGNIYNRYTLTMDDCAVSGGISFRGGAVGIRDSSSSGANYTELKNCTFLHNSGSVCGSSVGSWIDTNGATVMIENCTFDDTQTDAVSGVIGITAPSKTTSETNVTIKNCTVKNQENGAYAAYAVYANYGTLILEGDNTFHTADANIYLTARGRINADGFAPKSPATIEANFIGQFGTCATDKSACFTGDTKGISWNKADTGLYLNGLLQARDGSKFASFADALASGEHAVLTLLDDHTGDAEITGDLWLDLNGKELTGNLTGTGTLYGYDTSSDDYQGADGRITGTVSCNVAPHFKGSSADIGSAKRYMAVADNTGYTFHRFYLGVTHASIRPADEAVGYKAMFCGDEAVMAQLAETGTYGYTLSLEGGKSATVSKDKATLVSGQAVTARVANYDIANHSETPLTVSVFLTLADGSVIESTPVSYTFRQMAELINGTAASLSDAQKAAMQALIAKYETLMAEWKLNNLK